MDRYPIPMHNEIEKSEMEKEARWEKHFHEYGRGMSMYRTSETAELIIEGIPDKLRSEIWLIYSGAQNELATNIGEQSKTSYFMFFAQLFIFIISLIYRPLRLARGTGNDSWKV